MAPKQTLLRGFACTVALWQHAAAVVRTSTPQLGWNSYNYYNCYPNETIIKENAQALVDLGLADLGYTMVTTDCGWPSSNRTDDGKITWNSTLFPSGFPALGEYIHDLGLKFGLYSGAGKWQCTSEPNSSFLVASLGYETSDAETFASWGGDALKYDNCWANVTEGIVEYHPYEPDPSVRFAKMSSALDALDRPIQYQICQWGVGDNLGEWAPRLANSWRISNDITNSFSSIYRIANQVVPFWRHTRPGQYPDMDMLIIGIPAAALTPPEERTHLTLWLLAKSPLTIGAPLRTIAPSSLSILTNRAALAINQDPLGLPARLVRRYTEEGYDIWAGPLEGGRVVVGVVNWGGESGTVGVDLPGVMGVGGAGKVYDVWAGEELGAWPEEVEVEGHGSRLLVLADVTEARTRWVEAGYYAAVEAEASGGEVVECGVGECEPVERKVAGLVPGASVRFEGVVGPAGRALVGLDYINYDVALQSAWTNGTNTRNVTVSVNGARAKRWEVPISGGDWWETGRLDIEVEGLVEGSGNVVVVGVPEGGDPGPDLVGLAVLEEVDDDGEDGSEEEKTPRELRW